MAQLRASSSTLIPGNFILIKYFRYLNKRLKAYYNSNILMLVLFFQDVIEYWPEVKDDLTLVTWSHATNSKQKLEEALGSKCYTVIYTPATITLT